MIFASPPPERDPLRQAISALTRADETQVVERLIQEAAMAPELARRIEGRARQLVSEVRRGRQGQGGLDAFLHEYALSTREGVVLMCLAEALLRIPDAETADRLIRDKIGEADWQAHLGQSTSLFVNASTWALMLTGRVMALGSEEDDWPGVLGRLVRRSGEPVIRNSLTQAMRILGRQFVMGRTIEEALERALGPEREGYRYSYDMLGEAARTMADAERYRLSYERAIQEIGKASAGRGPIAGPGISVKLSALHPRYEFAQMDRVMAELVPVLKGLAEKAKALDIGFTVDAEESERLEPSLDVIERLALDPDLTGWSGLGLAVQAYQKRATVVIDWLADLAQRSRRRLMVRLVKGAYWDTEIKRAQERGFAGYPVFTRKLATDVSYLAASKRLLAQPDAFYPQFATHNAHTLAAIQELAGNAQEFEFQRLHGMGEALYAQVVGGASGRFPCRVYAPSRIRAFRSPPTSIARSAPTPRASISAPRPSSPRSPAP